jgi:hypothetical protein
MNDPIYGEIHGITRRADKEPVPAVDILVHAVDGSADRAVSSNGDGAFSVPNLSPGVYQLRASMARSVETLKTTVEVGKVATVELIIDSMGKNAESSSNTPPPQTAAQEPPRRAPESPLDGIYPSSDYLGPTIGVPDTDPIWPLTQALWDESAALKKAKIKIYGWLNPGGDVSTSKNSNVPESYAIVPNKVEMDQAVLRIERVPDTVQTDSVDWGFRLSTIYGIDYRYTTSQGWFSGQLLKHNSLYGAIPWRHTDLCMCPEWRRVW